MATNKLICLVISGTGVVSGAILGGYVAFHQGAPFEIAITTLSGTICGVIAGLLVALTRRACTYRGETVQSPDFSEQSISESDVSSMLSLELPCPKLSPQSSLEPPAPIESKAFKDEGVLISSSIKEGFFEVNLQSPKAKVSR